MSQNSPSNENGRVEITTEETDRRAFVCNAAAAATAATATGLAASSASAASLTKAESTAKTGAVSASFDPKYKVDIYHVQSVTEQILGRTGCPACGLVGIDLRFGLDPIINVDTEIPVNVTMHEHY